MWCLWCPSAMVAGAFIQWRDAADSAVTFRAALDAVSKPFTLRTSLSCSPQDSYMYISRDKWRDTCFPRHRVLGASESSPGTWKQNREKGGFAVWLHLWRESLYAELESPNISSDATPTFPFYSCQQSGLLRRKFKWILAWSQWSCFISNLHETSNCHSTVTAGEQINNPSKAPSDATAVRQLQLPFKH